MSACIDLLGRLWVTIVLIISGAAPWRELPKSPRVLKARAARKTRARGRARIEVPAPQPHPTVPVPVGDPEVEKKWAKKALNTWYPDNRGIIKQLEPRFFEASVPIKGTNSISSIAIYIYVESRYSSKAATVFLYVPPNPMGDRVVNALEVCEGGAFTISSEDFLALGEEIFKKFLAAAAA